MFVTIIKQGKEVLKMNSVYVGHAEGSRYQLKEHFDEIINYNQKVALVRLIISKIADGTAVENLGARKQIKVNGNEMCVWPLKLHDKYLDTKVCNYKYLTADGQIVIEKPNNTLELLDPSELKPIEIADKRNTCSQEFIAELEKSLDILYNDTHPRNEILSLTFNPPLTPNVSHKSWRQVRQSLINMFI